MNPQQDNQGTMDVPQPDDGLTQAPAPMVMQPQHPADPAPVHDDDQAGAGAPAVDDQDNNDTAGEYIMTDAPHAASPDPAASDTLTPVHPDDLLDLKQGALQQLTPLLGHLDQTPEEKFRTTMMMIQASDNQALLKVAYEAAQQITDEKTRAQALLDVVNEINYFTQQGGAAEQQPDAEAHEQNAL